MKRRWAGVFLALFSSISVLLSVLPAAPAYAAPGIGCPGGPAGPPSPGSNYTCPNGGTVKNGVYTDPLGCPGRPIAPITANYACANGGQVINGAYSPPNALGCPGNPPAPSNANYPCPGGGSVVNGAYLAPGAVPGAQPTDTTKPVDCDAGPGFTWIICGLIKLAVGAVDLIRDRIITPFLKEPAFDKNLPQFAAAHTMWSTFRNIASIFFILVFFLVIVGTALGFDNYTIKKVLPHLVAGAILVPFSWDLCAFVIDIGNTLGHGIADIVNAIPLTSGTTSIDLTSNFQLVFFGAVGTTAAIAIIPAVAPIGAGVIISMLIALLGVFVTLILRKIFILLAVIVSPFAILAWILPNTSKWFSEWWKNLFKLVMMYPIIMMLFALGKIFSATAGATVTNTPGDWVLPVLQIMGLILPLFMVPFAFKFAGKGLSAGSNAVGKFTGGLDKRFGKDSASAKQAAQNRERINLNRGAIMSSKANETDNRLKKFALNSGARMANRRAGFATPLKKSGMFSNGAAALAQDAARSKAVADQSLLNAKPRNKELGIPEEDHRTRLEAETITAAGKKRDEKAAREGLVSGQTKAYGTPEQLAAANQALYEQNKEHSGKAHVEKLGNAEGFMKTENDHEQHVGYDQYRDRAIKLGEAAESKDRGEVIGDISAQNDFDQKALKDLQANSPGHTVTIEEAHQMRMRRLGGSSGINAYNKMVGAEQEAMVNVKNSDDAAKAEIKRYAEEHNGAVIDVDQAHRNRLEATLKAGVNKDLINKQTAEGEELEFNRVTDAAGGRLDAKQVMDAAQLNSRDKLTAERSKLEAPILSTKPHLDTAQYLDAARATAVQNFETGQGNVEGTLRDMNKEAELAKIDLTNPDGYKKLYANMGKQAFEGTAITKADQLSRAGGLQKGAIKGNKDAVLALQKEALEAKKLDPNVQVPTVAQARTKILSNTSRTYTADAASDATTRYTKEQAEVNQLDAEIAAELGPVTNPTPAQTMAAESRVISNRNKDIRDDGLLKGQTEAAKRIQSQAKAATASRENIAAVAAGITAAPGVDKTALARTKIAATGGEVAGRAAGIKRNDEIKTDLGTQAGHEAQIDQEVTDTLKEEVRGIARGNGEPELTPDEVDLRVKALRPSRDRVLRQAATTTVEARNRHNAGETAYIAAKEKEMVAGNQAAAAPIAHEANIRQSTVEAAGNAAYAYAASQNKSEDETKDLVEAARKKAADDIQSGAITRPEMEQAALVATGVAARDKAVRDAGATDALTAAINQAVSDPTKLSADQQLEVDTENAISNLAAKRGQDEALWIETRPGAKLNRSFATAKEAQRRVSRDKVLDDRVAQAKQGKVQIFEYEKDPARPGDFFKLKLDANGNKIPIEEGTIRDINTSDSALASMKDEGVRLLEEGQIDRGIALLDKVGTMAKGREMLRQVQYDKFGRDDENPFNPKTSPFGDRTAVIWNKIVANIPFETAPDLHGPMIGVFKTADAAKLLKMDWRTQKTYFDYLSKRHDKFTVDGKDKEGEKLYNAMGNTIASIFDEKNQSSIEKLNDDSVEQMAKYAFKLDGAGRIIPNDYTDAGKRLANGNLKQQRALDLLKERYETLHS